MDCSQSPHWDDPHAGLPPNLGHQDPLSLKVRNSQKAGTVGHTWGTLAVRDHEDKAESGDLVPAEETLGDPGEEWELPGPQAHGQEARWPRGTCSRGGHQKG